ncbi:MAG: ATP-dependent DNA helicase RecG, partial [Clostridia bacterium]|nr:ATP-dependent DNA helicase RecG [Clostridia bacterium]
MRLDSDVRYLKGVGEKRAGLYRKIGINTVGDLIENYPRAYEDWSQTKEIAETIVGETACVKAMVCFRPEKAVIRKGMTIYKTAVTDGIDVMKITIFNNRFSAEKLEEGREFLFFGKVAGNLTSREMTNPAVAEVEGGDRIRPIYSQTKDLSTKVIEKNVRQALDNVKDELADTLPDEIRKKYNLSSLVFSLENIHFPKSEYNLYSARRRLIFEELLTLQLGMMLMRGKNIKKTGQVLKKDYTREFLSLLPFEATNAQKRAISEAVRDMTSHTPMNRLLQGDVGSGKTVVAAALIYNCAKNNIQSALMAPTEILAFQHYNTLKKLMENSGVEVVLLTGSNTASQKKAIKSKLKSGEAMLAVGTHALIQKDVEFQNLGLVITDEQHRFGVEQRGTLTQKGESAHVLVMSATPIPRTLALIIYGELDVSVLDELPAGRQRTETYSVSSELRLRALNYVKKHIDEGYQGYVVCPLVDDEDNESSMKAAKQYADELQNGVFKNYSVGLLHGKMKPSEKEAVMKKFSDGEISILVSTTVIEVGVDVPNAVIIVIENAERFGLSQLHQLRGRVGRGNIKSTCILISDAKNEEAQARLGTMCRTTDGFVIADEDLKLRGPGDFFGSRQHGLPELKIAGLMSDTKIMKEAQKTAKDILTDDPTL